MTHNITCIHHVHVNCARYLIETEIYRYLGRYMYVYACTCTVHVYLMCTCTVMVNKTFTFHFCSYDHTRYKTETEYLYIFFSASFDETVVCWDVTLSNTRGVEKCSFKQLRQLEFSSTVLSMKVGMD